MDDEQVTGEDVARRLARVWAGGVERVLSQGLPPVDVARSLVAVGLELWTQHEGPTAVAAHLAMMADGLQVVAGEVEDGAPPETLN